MVSYATGAYYAMVEGVRAMLQYEGYIKEELTKTFPDPISELILGYYDIHAEYSYCVGHTKMENDNGKVMYAYCIHKLKNSETITNFIYKH